MKNKVIYIVLGIVLLLIIALAVLYKPVEKFDKKVTLSYKETRPYATNICYKTLPVFFGTENIVTEKKSVLNWKDTSELRDALLFIVTKEFNPSNQEIQGLFHFVEKGNYVFISSLNFNRTTKDFFSFETDNYFNYYNNNTYYSSSDSNNYLKLLRPFYKKDTTFNNFCKASSLYFTLNSKEEKFSALGKNKNDHVDFMKARAGKGAFFFQSNPFVFTNFSLLQNSMQAYYQQALSAVPGNVNKVIWDDYYLYRKEDYTKKKPNSLLRVLFQYPSFVWAFWLAIGLCGLYLLIYFKRKQRFILPVKPLKNESLYFAETIGRLYFDKGDHINLAKKMTTYFLEFIRTKYSLNTSHLNNDFVEKLSLKSGYDKNETHQLIQAVVNVIHSTEISQLQLNEYYLIIQKFYKNI